jgi:hypothetical protein
MPTRFREDTLRNLDLPDSFEDLTGIINADVKVIVRALAERASERLLLTRRQTHDLKCTLWNKVTQAINETMEQLTVERH